jgi:glycogen operon protein
MRARRASFHIDPSTNRTYRYWHVFVAVCNQARSMVIEWMDHCIPGEPIRPDKVLLDPYGRAVVIPRDYSRDGTPRRDNSAAAMKVW